MGKCNWKNIKGTRAGQECGIFGTKVIDGKFYCGNHYKYLADDKPSESPVVKSACSCEHKEEIKVEPVKVEPVKVEPIKKEIKVEELKIEEPIVEVEKSFDNGDSLEDILDQRYKKEIPESDFEIVKKKLNILIDKVDFILSQILRREIGIQDEEELPEMETFDT
jgi:hypothetical protein